MLTTIRVSKVDIDKGRNDPDAHPICAAINRSLANKFEVELDFVRNSVLFVTLKYMGTPGEYDIEYNGKRKLPKEAVEFVKNYTAYMSYDRFYDPTPFTFEFDIPMKYLPKARVKRLKARLKYESQMCSN